MSDKRIETVGELIDALQKFPRNDRIGFGDSIYGISEIDDVFPDVTTNFVTGKETTTIVIN